MLHVAPQLIPVGELATVPVPVPAFVTVSVYETGKSNVAVTLCACDIVTTQVVAVPAHAPDHPVKLEPVAFVAVSVTAVPLV